MANWPVAHYCLKHIIADYEWMNGAFIYCFIVYCCTPKELYNHVGGGGGGSLLNHQQCAASTWIMRRLPQDNGTSALTTHQLQVERRESHRDNQVYAPHTSYRWRGERVIEPIKWMGIIRRSWLTRASGENLARTPGLHPYSLRGVPWDF